MEQGVVARTQSPEREKASWLSNMKRQMQFILPFYWNAKGFDGVERISLVFRFDSVCVNINCWCTRNGKKDGDEITKFSPRFTDCS